MTDQKAAVIAKLPLWLYPFILFSVFGLTMAYKKAATLLSAGPMLRWFLTPQHSGAVSYTLIGILVCGAIWLWADRGGFTDRIVPFARPRLKYWLWAIVALVVTWVMPPAYTRFIISLGLHGRSYDIRDPEIFAMVTVYAVLIGPACEEILFRGFGIGYLMARDVNRWLAGGIVMVPFLLIHLPTFGPGGVLLVLPFTLAVTVLRIVSGNLTPGLILHVMNNIVAYLVLPMVWSGGATT